MKMTKTELIEIIARDLKDAETFYKAADAACYNTQLRKLNLLESASNVACGLMYLNNLHNNKYKDEFNAAYELEKEIEAAEVTYEYSSKVREAIAVLTCIVKYDKNYFKGEEGYLNP